MKIAIIGSGVAGLTAGAALAKAGHQVDIYEQYHRAGGLASTITKNGYHWDLGQLMIEGLGKDEPLGRILDELGIFDQVTAKADFRGYVFPDYEIRKPEIYQGMTWRIEALKQQFPDEARGLNRYWQDYIRFTRVMTLARRMDRARGLARLRLQLQLYLALLPLLPKAKMNASQLMEHYFDDDALKMVFISILADFFTPPSQFQGLGVFALNSELSFDERMPAEIGKNAVQLSLYSLLGGIRNLTGPMADLIESLGGQIHLDSPVEKIVIENQTARGVVVRGDFHPADVVLASGSVRQTFFDLVGKTHLPQDFMQRVNEQHLMDAVFMVHLGLNMDPSPYVHGAVTYYYGTYDLEGGIQKARSGEYHGGADGFVVHVPTLHSPEMAPKGKHAMTIYTICPNFLTEGDWETEKEQWADQLIAHAEAFIPGLAEHTEERLILSPVDFQKIAHMPHFAFGGLCPVMDAPRIEHRTPVKNLWFIGQQSESGGGVMNVQLAAYKVAGEILNIAS
jgi:phytoene dehydrogenase-like protein